jgi:hypothetical protein
LRTFSPSAAVSMGAQTLKYSRCRLGMGTGVGRPSPGTRVRGSTASLGTRLGSTRFNAPCSRNVTGAIMHVFSQRQHCLAGHEAGVNSLQCTLQ